MTLFLGYDPPRPKLGILIKRANFGTQTFYVNFSEQGTECEPGNHQFPATICFSEATAALCSVSDYKCFCLCSFWCCSLLQRRSGYLFVMPNFCRRRLPKTEAIEKLTPLPGLDFRGAVSASVKPCKRVKRIRLCEGVAKKGQQIQPPSECVSHFHQKPTAAREK